MTLMTPISLTCPALTGGAFPRWYDVAHDNREAAKTPSRRRTVPSTPIARACNPFGAAEAIMHVHGFTRLMLAKLIRAGLVTAHSETGDTIAVGRIRITDAGRRWLEDAAKSELYGA